MASFKRALFGYRRPDVDTALSSKDARIAKLERHTKVLERHAGTLERHAAKLQRQVTETTALEVELESLSGMVIEREREIRGLREQLRDAGARYDRNATSLEAVSARLEEIQAQARGQATRIRMKALDEAVAMSMRAQAMAEAVQADATNGAGPEANGNGHAKVEPRDVFEGLVRVEIGPLGDFSQLVGFEDAAEQIGATSEISVERFSEGRATLSMRLNEPVELLRELEERSPLEFRVRHTADDSLILDVDEDDGSEQQAA
jgi:DNA repair exonuclease SbcCD ATPase subunit